MCTGDHDDPGVPVALPRALLAELPERLRAELDMGDFAAAAPGLARTQRALSRKLGAHVVAYRRDRPAKTGPRHLCSLVEPARLGPEQLAALRDAEAREARVSLVAYTRPLHLRGVPVTHPVGIADPAARRRFGCAYRVCRRDGLGLSPAFACS